jgi:hypothetical protein
MLFAVTACGAAAPPPPPNTLTTPRPGATPSATPSTAFPAEAAKPDPNFDTGYTVLITGSGFQPAALEAPCCQAVTWRNQTSSPVTVAFNAVVGGSGQPIPPGGVYVFVPQNNESIAYHSREHPALKGVVQVD